MQTLIEQLSQQLQQFEQQVQQQIQQMRTTINALLSNSNTTTTATTPATAIESSHSYNNDWLKQMFQPLYDIKLKPLDLILTSAREQYYSDLQNEIPILKGYYTKDSQGKTTTYLSFVLDGGLSFTQPNTPERQIQLQGWRKYFDFTIPADDITPFQMKKKPNLKIPSISPVDSVKKRAKRPATFAILDPVSYEDICYLAGHLPSSKPQYRELDIQSLIEYYGLSPTENDMFTRNPGKFNRGDY